MHKNIFDHFTRDGSFCYGLLYKYPLGEIIFVSEKSTQTMITMQTKDNSDDNHNGHFVSAPKC